MYHSAGCCSTVGLSVTGLSVIGHRSFCHTKHSYGVNGLQNNNRKCQIIDPTHCTINLKSHCSPFFSLSHISFLHHLSPDLFLSRYGSSEKKVIELVSNTFRFWRTCSRNESLLGADAKAHYMQAYRSQGDKFSRVHRQFQSHLPCRIPFISTGLVSITSIPI